MARTTGYTLGVVDSRLRGNDMLITTGLHYYVPLNECHFLKDIRCLKYKTYRPIFYITSYHFRIRRYLNHTVLWWIPAFAGMREMEIVMFRGVITHCLPLSLCFRK